MTTVSRRHSARRLALQGLCCLDAQGPSVGDLVDLFIQDSDEPSETQATAGKMISQALADLDKCDQVLSRHTRDWDLDRLAMVDRSILRLAVGEFVAGKTPFKVVIVEAIKLAREFSTAESPRFINGVLDSVAKELVGKDAEAHQELQAETSADETS